MGQMCCMGPYYLASMAPPGSKNLVVEQATTALSCHRSRGVAMNMGDLHHTTEFLDLCGELASWARSGL